MSNEPLLDLEKIEYMGNLSIMGGNLTGVLLKILIGIALFAIMFYSLMFILKLRVIQDTVDVSASNVAKLATTLNLILSLLGSLLAFILILL